jgi:aryl-alcohol dehydrogenase-like predicted oxidoreductase
MIMIAFSLLFPLPKSLLNVQYRRLGKTELQVSVIGIGTWQLGGGWGKSFQQTEVDALFHRAGELGINFVDTAECYGDHVSERLIGQAIKNQREKWIIATKFGHNHQNALGPENYQAKQVLLQLEASLKALQTDCIDLYQLHSGTREQFDNQELWTMLDKQVSAGKVRFLGNSIGNPNMLFQVQKSTEYGISVIQTIYNAIRLKAEETVFPAARQQDLGVIARVPLASGFLSGKYRPGHQFPENDVRSQRSRENIDQEINLALEALQQKPPAEDPVIWSNQWCLRKEEISTVIPGIKNIKQLEQNAAAGMQIAS